MEPSTPEQIKPQQYLVAGIDINNPRACAYHFNNFEDMDSGSIGYTPRNAMELIKRTDKAEIDGLDSNAYVQMEVEELKSKAEGQVAAIENQEKLDQINLQEIKKMMAALAALGDDELVGTLVARMESLAVSSDQLTPLIDMQIRALQNRIHYQMEEYNDHPNVTEGEKVRKNFKRMLQLGIKRGALLGLSSAGEK